MPQEYWNALGSTLGSADSWAKLAVLMVLSPLWWPIVKSMWREVGHALAPEGGLYANKKPRPIERRNRGEDPFVNIPRPSHRGALLRQGTASSRARSSTPAAASRPSARGTVATSTTRRGF